MISLYSIIHIMSQVLGTYAIYQLMSVFHHERILSKGVVFFTFAAYYVITIFTYFKFNTPIITLTVNLICYFLLTFNYKSDLKKRLISAILIYAIMLCCELIIVTITGYIHFPLESKNNYDSIFGVVCINLFYYFVSLIMKKFQIKKTENIPRSYWIAIFLMPLSSLVIVFTVLTNESLNQVEIFANLMIIFAVDFMAFFLYEKIIRFMNNEKEKQMAIQKNAYYEKQLDLMDFSLKSTRSLRHDMKNHLATIYTSLNNGYVEQAQKYIEDVMNVYKTNNGIASGNFAIDSILNFKNQEANQNGVDIVFDIDIPSNISIKPYDAAIILGNLLDNAIEAVVKSDVIDKKINCNIKFNKGVLLIDIKNSFDGNILHKGNEFITTKSDKKMHGLGLKNVKASVEKYNGSIDIDHNNDTYEVDIMLYV